jgi:hypothetical protein
LPGGEKRGDVINLIQTAPVVTLLLYVVTTIRHFRAEADAAWTASFA